MNNNISDEESVVDLCYDHVGGWLGEAFLKFFLKEKWISKLDEEYILTDKGIDELELMGVDVKPLSTKNGKKVDICFEKKYGIIYEHVGHHLGALLMDLMLERNWLEKKPDNTFRLTSSGESGLRSLGVTIY